MKYIFKEEVDTLDKMKEFIDKKGKTNSNYIIIHKNSNIDKEIYNFSNYLSNNNNYWYCSYRFMESGKTIREFRFEDLDSALIREDNIYYFI